MFIIENIRKKPINSKLSLYNEEIFYHLHVYSNPIKFSFID